MLKNVAGQTIGAQLIAKADGTPVTTGTTTCYVTGDNGTQTTGSVGSGVCTHKGNGFWTYAPAQAETNYAHVAFTFVNSTAVVPTIQVYTMFPQTGDAFARLGAPAGASVSADVAAVAAKTGQLAFTSGKVQADVKAINATTLAGNGDTVPWGPA